MTLWLLHPKERGSHNLPSAAQCEEDSHLTSLILSFPTSGLAIAVDQVGLKTEDLADVTGEAIMDDQCWDSEQWERDFPGAIQQPVLRQQVGRQRAKR